MGEKSPVKKLRLRECREKKTNHIRKSYALSHQHTRTRKGGNKKKKNKRVTTGGGGGERQSGSRKCGERQQKVSLDELKGGKKKRSQEP